MIQDLYLHQIIDGHTRKNNILDLFFCSDTDIIVNHEKLENVLFSDHALCIVNTLIASDPIKTTNKDKLYTTDIPMYNLMKAEDTDWDKLNEELSSLDWDSIFSLKDMNDMADDMISNIETAVKKSMKLLDNSEPSGFT